MTELASAEIIKMSDVIAQRAVVIGAGMGGLAAAKAIAPYFQQVTVLERDALPEAAAPRIGTPQARHAHALLSSGEQALEELFPGIGSDFRNAGAVILRGQDVLFERPGYDPFPRRDFGFETISLSRPAIERVCRRRLEGELNVDIRSLARVVGLVSSPDRGAVTAVQYEDERGAVHEFAVDLVVDASGRAIPTLSFLDCIGSPKPKQTEIGVDVGYASAIFEPSDASRDWMGLFHFGMPPGEGRGALIFPIENGGWMVSIGRRPSGEMPSDIESLVVYTRTLRTPTAWEALRTAKPVTDVARYGFPASLRRHFHELDLPRGLVPIADSICRFNPLFGQGMSVAAMEAITLGKLLAARRSSPNPLNGLGADFLAEIQETLEAPWGVAISDFAYAHTTGERPPDLAQRLQYSKALLSLAAQDADVHRLMVEVSQLMKPQSALGEPAIVERARALMSPAPA
jgi:2-polyprenyl-6-methoxyphenol hydroxylase-like FAD-dependent oxidoreductase